MNGKRVKASTARTPDEERERDRAGGAEGACAAQEQLLGWRSCPPKSGRGKRRRLSTPSSPSALPVLGTAQRAQRSSGLTLMPAFLIDLLSLSRESGFRMS
mmetsp:Transcript_59/g.132  ORF Transcript_59/g.132 Transcript_59/m.132 type:complete len:101 (+) Transcript_59:39-341(+)